MKSGKNFLLLALIIIGSTLTSNVATAGRRTLPSIEIEADVTFGRASKKCAGFGVCSASGSIRIVHADHARMAEPSCKPSKSIISYNPYLHSLQFEVSLKDLASNQSEKLKAILASVYFPVEEDFTLSKDLQAAFGLKSEVTIKKGNYLYSIDKANNSIKVQIGLNK